MSETLSEIHPTPAEAVAILRKTAIQKGLPPGDNNFDDAANVIERLHAEMLAARKKLAELEAANEGWIDWAGGHCPVPPGTRVDFRVFPDHVFLNREADAWNWGPVKRPANPTYGTITGYRLAALPPIPKGD